MAESVTVVDGRALFPRPGRVDIRSGCLALSDLYPVAGEFPSAYGALLRLYPSLAGRAAGSARLQFHRAELQHEAYRLEIGPSGIVIGASSEAGAYYAVQTLAQILPHEPDKFDGGKISAVIIQDAPKYRWRGFMLDVSRHFFKAQEIFQLIDWLADHKFNVFHWHLTDDGGWRLESECYPDLTRRGAWREVRHEAWHYSDIWFPGPSGGHQVYGGYYTREDVRQIVRYAADRHIQVVPEIDVPGHCLAACQSYPSLCCTGPAAQIFNKATGMASPNVLCGGNPEVYRFLESILTEAAELFPSPYLHIGGDEVSQLLWENCPTCLEMMRHKGLDTAAEIQGVFMSKLSVIARTLGKRLVGWDEVMGQDLPGDVAVMSWRGRDGGREAAQAGHEVVMTPTRHCYFDYSYQTTPSQTVASFDPLDGVPEEHQSLILGGQANLWTEYVPTWSELQRRVFPRLGAMADALWSGPDVDWTVREPSYVQLLESRGILYEGSHSLPATSQFQEGVLYLND